MEGRKAQRARLYQERRRRGRSIGTSLENISSGEWTIRESTNSPIHSELRCYRLRTF